MQKERREGYPEIKEDVEKAMKKIVREVREEDLRVNLVNLFLKARELLSGK